LKKISPRVSGFSRNSKKISQNLSPLAAKTELRVTAASKRVAGINIFSMILKNLVALTSHAAPKNDVLKNL
jgi:hypothetical protein